MAAPRTRSPRSGSFHLLLLVLAVLAVAAASSDVEQSSDVRTADRVLAEALGLRRRRDDKFDLFNNRQHEGDGYGLRRRWQSKGKCPPELIITDSWGQIGYVASSRRGNAFVEPRVCSWRLRPGLFLRDGYVRDSSGPITLTFTALSLSPYERIEVWAPDASAVRSTPTVERLKACDAIRDERFASSAAETAFEVAPGTPATQALIITVTTGTTR